MSERDAREGLSVHAKRIVERLKALSAEWRESPPEVDDMICQYVGVLRQEHVPREQIVTMLEAAIANSGVEAERMSDGRKADVIHGCLAQYRVSESVA